MDWKRLLTFSAVAAGSVAVLYFLLREEPETSVGGSRSVEEEERKRSVEDVTIEEIREIIASIVESQEKMRSHMRALTKELLKSPSTAFDDVYKRVLEVQPTDPLEKRGLSMADFDQLLNKYQGDPEVRLGIARIMGVPPEMPASGGPAKMVAAEKTVEVHAFMLSELEKLLGGFMAVPDRSSYDVKTVTLAAQAIVGAKVEEKYGLTSEDIEHAVVAHQSTLATDQEFASINMKMQQTMAQLMGSQP